MFGSIGSIFKTGRKTKSRPAHFDITEFWLRRITELNMATGATVSGAASTGATKKGGSKMKKKLSLIVLSIIMVASIVSGVFIVKSIGDFTPKADAIYVPCDVICFGYAVASCPDCDEDTQFILWDLCINAHCR